MFSKIAAFLNPQILGGMVMMFWTLADLVNRF
jgi:hypothetical protein